MKSRAVRRCLVLCLDRGTTWEKIPVRTIAECYRDMLGFTLDLNGYRLAFGELESSVF
jgi:hypothetical protein